MDHLAPIYYTPKEKLVRRLFLHLEDFNLFFMNKLNYYIEVYHRLNLFGKNPKSVTIIKFYTDICV